MLSLNLALNAVFASLAALGRTMTRCGAHDEDNEWIRQVVHEGEDGISRMTIPMIVVTPPDADPILRVERAMARANAPPSRIPVPKGGLTSAKRARHVLQEVSDGMDRAAEAMMLAQEGVEEVVAETLVAIEDEYGYQQEVIANTIAGILESMRDDSDGSEESQEGSAPST